MSFSQAFLTYSAVSKSFGLILKIYLNGLSWIPHSPPKTRQSWLLRLQHDGVFVSCVLSDRVPIQSDRGIVREARRRRRGVLFCEHHLVPEQEHVSKLWFLVTFPHLEGILNRYLQLSNHLVPPTCLMILPNFPVSPGCCFRLLVNSRSWTLKKKFIL